MHLVWIGIGCFLAGWIFRSLALSRHADSPPKELNLSEQITASVTRGGYTIKPPMLLDIEYSDFYGDITSLISSACARSGDIKPHVKSVRRNNPTMQNGLMWLYDLCIICSVLTPAAVPPY
jgi:hypothetical protein